MTVFAIVLAALAIGIVVFRSGQKSSGPPSLRAPLRLILLPIGAMVVQIVALRSSAGSERTLPYVASAILILTFLAANWPHAPMRLLAVGFGLNLLPILANGGYMPITPEAMAQIHPGTSALDWTIGLVRVGSKDIVLPAGQAMFWFLGDVFVLSAPFPMPVAFSLGDIVLLVAFGWAVYSLTPTKAKMIDHIELERLVSAGAVDRQFRELLMRDPLRAAEGYQSDRFRLTSEERDVLAQARTEDYPTFVQFIASWITGQRSRSRFE